MVSCRNSLIASLAFLCFGSSFLGALATQVTYDAGNLLIDGVPRIIISGSIHYPRSTPQMWPDLIEKSKQGGLDAIETYVFWDRHEPQQGQYDFSGRNDLVRFLKTIQDAGLYAILRIGPYVCAEWNLGGFPMWLNNLPGIQLRTDNQVYKDQMQQFTQYIMDMMKQEKLFAPQGGPIILSQIENEYGNIMSSYGEAGKKYIEWCASMALSMKIDVPWIMCQQEDAPQPMINTCNGYYCHDFKPNNEKSPKIWTENWTGWFKGWGDADPHRPTQDLAYAVARFYQSGGVLQNYYMYHGGTNFGRTSGGPYISTTYDYDAPLDEFGNLAQPKWGHLKELHEIIKSGEKILTQKAIAEKVIGNVTFTEFKDQSGGSSFCFLSNDDNATDANVDLGEKGKFYIPAWSVSILPDCKNVAYSSAKITTQTSIMEKKPNTAEEEPLQLNWEWRPEIIKETLRGLGAFATKQLLEQKTTTVDATDYLWYMTSVNVGPNDFPADAKMSLRVNTTGHVLHAYVNGRYMGSEWAKDGKYDFIFEQPIQLKPGANQISLLSATVGLKNYGSQFELTPTGIVGGPVQLIGAGSVNVTKDVSSNHWMYKAGLDGERKKLYDPESHHSIMWKSDTVATKRRMTWYKTTFKSPLGKDPVVVDLQGMGKGEAWVNGHSLGRFWPSFTSTQDSCETCDYRGYYKAEKCRTNCGVSSQRWYHVPRSFLFDDRNNTLILFEEIGGNPSQVNFQTVTIGKACGSVDDGNILELSCQGGRTISAIEFASYGDPQGSCGSFTKGACEAVNSLSAVQMACIGKETCSIRVSETTLGASKCGANMSKTLAVQAVC